MARARAVYEQAAGVVRDVLTDARPGKPVELERVAGLLTGPVLRNNDALISLSRIKRKDDYTFQPPAGGGTAPAYFSLHIGSQPAHRLGTAPSNHQS